ncbi:hypothetical protein VNO77_26777 [Canavalia gladiata]|uniref:Uncharacterized protein n=1 Tax=Canavalia gladiata TaxID=3824 RepID=A0AAN9KSW1_CANGL
MKRRKEEGDGVESLEGDGVECLEGDETKARNISDQAQQAHTIFAGSSGARGSTHTRLVVGLVLIRSTLVGFGPEPTISSPTQDARKASEVRLESP